MSPGTAGAHGIWGVHAVHLESWLKSAQSEYFILWPRRLLWNLNWANRRQSLVFWRQQEKTFPFLAFAQLLECKVGTPVGMLTPRVKGLLKIVKKKAGLRDRERRTVGSGVPGPRRTFRIFTWESVNPISSFSQSKFVFWDVSRESWLLRNPAPTVSSLPRKADPADRGGGLTCQRCSALNCQGSGSLCSHSGCPTPVHVPQTSGWRFRRLDGMCQMLLKASRKVLLGTRDLMPRLVQWETEKINLRPQTTFYPWPATQGGRVRKPWALQSQKSRMSRPVSRVPFSRSLLTRHMLENTRNRWETERQGPGALHGEPGGAQLTTVVNEYSGAKLVNCSGAQVWRLAN